MADPALYACLWFLFYLGAGQSQGWADGSSDHVVGECKFDFVGDRDDELSVTAGQRVNLAPAGTSVSHHSL